MSQNPDLLLVQIPNLREQSYLVGVASIKSYLQTKNFSVECYNPVGAVLAKNPDYKTPELVRIFSNELEYGAATISPPLLEPMVEEMAAKIRETNPRVLGFSLIYGNIKTSQYCAQQIKKRFPELCIVLGGPGVKVPNAVIKDNGVVDYIVYGDGEITLVELLNKLLRKDSRALSSVAGLEYRENGEWKKSCERPSPENLFDYPQPDYSDFVNDPCAKQMLIAQPLSLGRGCPFRCRFCAVRNYGSNYRHYEVSDCIAYIRKVVESGNRHFFVHDPITNGNPFWLRSFCQAIIDAKLDIHWGGSIRLEKYLHDGPTLDLLFEAGFRTMINGFESGSPRVLKHMKKFDNMEIVGKLFDKVAEAKKRYPIKVMLQLIVGYPNETEEDFQMTLDFIKEHRDAIDEISSCSSFLMIQNESDDLYDMTMNRTYGLNVLSEANWASIYSTPKIRNDRMLKAEAWFKELELPYRMFYAEFYHHVHEKDHAQPYLDTAHTG